MTPKTITVENLADSSAQEVFDFIAFSGLNQGKQSKGEDEDGHPFCLYRGPNGTKCFAGFILSDQNIKENHIGEGSDWKNLVINNGFPSEHADLIGALQILHDCNPVENWPSMLYNFALDRKLSPLIVDQFINLR